VVFASVSLLPAMPARSAALLPWAVEGILSVVALLRSRALDKMVAGRETISGRNSKSMQSLVIETALTNLRARLH